MGPSLSPNPVWNLVLSSLAWYTITYFFIFWPLAYWFLGRPYDKIFELKNYTIEKDTWFIGPGWRLASYTMGIVLQPYRGQRVRNKLLKRVVKGRFEYQDMVYGKVVDFRKKATKVQIIISYIMWIGFVLFMFTLILLLFHNFILYPEVGRASLIDNNRR